MELLLVLGLLLAVSVGKWRVPRFFGDALCDTLQPKPGKMEKDARLPWPQDWKGIEEKIEAVIVTPPTPIPVTPRVLPWSQLPPYKAETVQLPPLRTSAPKRVVAPPPPPPAVQARVVAPAPPQPSHPGTLPPISRSPLRGRGHAPMPRHKTAH